MQKLSYKIRSKLYCFDSNRLNEIETIVPMRQPLVNLGIIVDTALKIPPYTGVTYRLFYLSRKLVELGVQVKIFSCNRNIKKDLDAQALINNSGIELHIIPEKIFYDIKKLNEIIVANKVNVLQVEDPVSVLRYHSIAANLKIPIVLEMHDIEPTLQKYFRKSRGKINLSRAVSYFACQLSDAIICMTPSDSTELFEKIGVNPDKINIIPNPIDFSEFQFYGPNIRKPNIIFIGNMFYGPNRKAAEYIITKIYPILSQKHKDITFTFVGMVPNELKKRVNKPKIIFTGPVDNINSILQEATIALCPTTQGSGMKVKILNYCASGLPIITTSLGASGYEKVSSLIVEDNLDAFPDIIGQLLNQSAKMKKVGAQNKALAKKYYDINIIAKNMVAVYRELVALNPSNYKISRKMKHKLPLPLWLEEKRAKRIKNEKYYVIKNKTIKIV